MESKYFKFSFKIENNNNCISYQQKYIKHTFQLYFILLGRSLCNFVFLVKFKHDFFYFLKYFMKLCFLHFDRIPFAIFRARVWFHVHTMFDPFWQKIGWSGFWLPDFRFYNSKNSAEIATSNSRKVPSLE